MRETHLYRIQTIKYGYRSVGGHTFFISASSRAEAIRLGKPQMKAGYEIEKVVKTTSVHLENSL
jgi:hypothetical protein